MVNGLFRFVLHSLQGCPKCFYVLDLVVPFMLVWESKPYRVLGFVPLLTLEPY